jgi:hypothetical protein
VGGRERLADELEPKIARFFRGQRKRGEQRENGGEKVAHHVSLMASDTRRTR